jgi:hypothetical protein
MAIVAKKTIGAALCCEFNSDPSGSATPASIGSMGIHNNTIYYKSDSGDTDWVALTLKSDVPSYTNVIGHWSASNSSTVKNSSGLPCVDGEIIEEWEGLVGGTLTKDASFGNPIYQTEIQNGLPIIRTDNDIRMYLSANLEVCSTIVVTKDNQTSSVYGPILSGLNENCWVSENIITYPKKILDPTLAPTEPFMQPVWFGDCWIDGVSQPSVSAVDIPTVMEVITIINNPSYNSGLAYFGSIGSDRSYQRYFNADYCEIVVFDDFISTETRETWEDYLIAKWDI